MTTPTGKPRLGTVRFSRSYLVDMNNPTMVARAKASLLEDILSTASAVQFAGAPAPAFIAVVETIGATSKDIPEFLRDGDELDR